MKVIPVRIDLMDKKSKKIRSLKYYVVRLWLLVTGILFVLFTLFSLIIAASMKNEILNSSRVFADHYAGNLNRDIQQMADTVDEMYVNNIFFRRLIIYALDDYDWVDNTWHIQSSLQEKSSAMSFLGGLFFYDTQKDSMRSAYSRENSDNFLNDRLIEWIRMHNTDSQDSGYLVQNDDVWLVSYKTIRGKTLGYLINLSDYVRSNELEDVYYIDRNGQTVCRVGSLFVSPEALEQVIVKDGQLTRGNLLLSAADVPAARLHLIIVMKSQLFLSLLSRPDFLFLVILLPVLTLIALLFFYRFHKQALLMPTEHILYKINEMKADLEDEKLTVSEKRAEAIMEYREINNRIDTMLQEINDLTEARHREELNARSALLQYYQLQIDPHFYLNCLNSISSLVQNETPEIANDMIMSLSAHFRYVFQSHRSLVSLSEELQELRNYCSIYNIKGGVPILLTIDAPDDVMDIRIPILTIQTFVENSIKHVTKKGKVLSVKVSANLDETQSSLMIRITDNGPGYSDDILETLNQPTAEFNFDSQHVGIQNLKYRCRLMYDGREHFRFYNVPQGGAATEITLPENTYEYSDH